jgi:hypothetical protein
MIKKTTESIRNFYDVLTSGMSVKELERLVNIDAKGTYEFYLRHVKPEAKQPKSIKNVFIFCWNLFLAFLLRLTPARRLFYAIALFGLFYSFYTSELSYAFYSFLVMNFLLALEVADKLITKNEIDLAREIQLSLLPHELSPPRGYSLAAHSEVALNVGGDYYDLLTLSEGSSLVVIGDVSGKGMSAALYMVKVQTALQLLARECSDPRELLIRLNRYLYGQLKKNYFLTIALVQLFEDGTFRYCRAGHTPAVLYHPFQGHWKKLRPNGAALGLTPSNNGGSSSPIDQAWNGQRVYETTIETEQGELAPGDVLVLYTDGVVEGVNEGGHEFGEHRIIDVVARNGMSSAPEIKEALLWDLISFRGNAELRDDTTFFIIKRLDGDTTTEKI